MGGLRALTLAGIALLGWAAPCTARIHGQMYCWALDSELPVACDEEAGDEEEASQGFQLLGIRRQP